MTRIFAAACLSALLCVPLTQAQSRSVSIEPQRGGTELEVFSGSGVGVSGVTAGNGVWYAGGRYGWVLTDPHGPGFLRSRFEYAVDVAPAFLVFQPGGTAYGFSFDAIVLKWNFEGHHRATPYFELTAGGLVTTHQIPRGANNFNFTPSAAFGVRFPRGRNYWSVEVRYLHISDAQITAFNPGTDTVGIRVGFGRFRR
jgi:hypothetical protein